MVVKRYNDCYHRISISQSSASTNNIFAPCWFIFLEISNENRLRRNMKILCNIRLTSRSQFLFAVVRSDPQLVPAPNPISATRTANPAFLVSISRFAFASLVSLSVLDPAPSSANIFLLLNSGILNGCRVRMNSAN